MYRTYSFKPSKCLTAPTEKRVCLRWAAFVFAAVASLLMVVGCAAKKQGPKQNRAATFVTTLPTDQANKAYSASKLACETSNGICPDAIGLWVAKFPGMSETEVYQCTSFLVGHDIVATNSHCVPNDLKAPGSQCSGRIQVIFGRTTKSLSQTFDCDQVLSATEIAEDKNDPEFGRKPDYAFIKLKLAPQKRDHLKFNRAGLQEGLQLNVLAIDPSQDTREVRGTLRLKKCQATQNSIAAQGFTHDFAPVAAATGCKTIQGNSGSPMLDVSGKVRGILYGGNTSISLSGNIEAPAQLESATLLSNVACISVPDRVILPGEIPSACANVSDTNVFQTLLNKSILEVEPLFAEWKKQAPTAFSFDLVKSDKPGAINIAYPSPTCVQPLDRWNPAPTKNADGTANIEFEVPVWSQTQSLNAKLQAQITTKQTNSVKFQMIVKLDDLENSQPTYIVQEAKSLNGLITQSSKGHVAICP